MRVHWREEEKRDMTENVIATSENGRYRVRLVLDQDSYGLNPRTNQGNLTNVITLKGQHYIDVDKDGGPLQHGWDHFAGREDGVELFIRWARIFHGATAVEDNPYDGARSIWYLMPEKAAESGWSPEKTIEAEIKEYRSWAEGDVWFHVIEELTTSARVDNRVTGEAIQEERTAWEQVDSCGGYIGREWAEEAAREAFAPYAEEGKA